MDRTKNGDVLNVPEITTDEEVQALLDDMWLERLEDDRYPF